MSIQNIQSPRKALNKAYLKIKPCREEVDLCKRELKKLLHALRPAESEEFNKNHISAFLRESHYKGDYFINTKNRADLVIHNGNRDKDSVGVLIETKRPGNKSEMPGKDNLNTKAIQELVLYFLDERIAAGNDELKHLVATNGYEWFVFDAHVFEKAFAQDKKLVAKYKDFRAGRLTSTGTDYFYTEIAAPGIAEHAATLVYTWFDIREYESLIDNPVKESRLVPLLKILSPAHLLKLPFLNDSNSLDRSFYTELLYIIGLSEIKSGGKKLIERFPKEARQGGSLLESTISQLDSLGKMEKFRGKQAYGATHEERLFTVALELVLTWVNRILFLKLLEGQLIAYNEGKTEDRRLKIEDLGGWGEVHREDAKNAKGKENGKAFLSAGRIENLDDLNTLFFQVLAQKPESRRDRVSARFGDIPYLNSSLFEPTEMENECFAIAQLDDGETLPIHPQSVLKDSKGRRRTGELNTLVYLFEFLNAYDFSSEGSEDIQEENKTLINASVLGLIFEKINGYKDGSFYTPGFITMYMCREAIRRAVVQKFNEAWGKQWTSFEDLQEDLLEEIKHAPEGREALRKKANDVLNTVRICDPAVGSGHFLVSALNEMIVIKSELRILTDRQGKLLSGYQFEVANDELIVTDQDDQLFEYNRFDKQSQRIQEALFHEKQAIIENCLFGVDINPNSVKICRLRLWIELLKNAYYRDDGQLETLPNIDINIKCGNSLLSRFPLDADVKQALRKSKWDVSSYRLAVAAYRNAQSKDIKRSMEALIQDIKGNFRSEISANDPKVVKLRKLQGEIMDLTMQTELFKKTAKEKAVWNKRVKDYTAQARKLEAEIEEIKTNKIFENAFEWRFEFPEVLDDAGTFVGFDAVIGNPPYMNVEMVPADAKQLYKRHYQTFFKRYDLFGLFFELALLRLAHSKGSVSFIIPQQIANNMSYNKLRDLMLERAWLHDVLYLGDKIFEAANNDVCVLSLCKTGTDNIRLVYALDFENQQTTTVPSGYFKQYANVISFGSDSGGEAIFSKMFGGKIWLLKNKFKVFQGIVSGNNTAFLPTDENIKTANLESDLLRPVLLGRDFEKWAIRNTDRKILYINGDTQIEEYPSANNWLSSFRETLETRRECVRGVIPWYSLQWPRLKADLDYVPKLMLQRTRNPRLKTRIVATLDASGIYGMESIIFVVPTKKDAPIHFLLGILNSNLMNYLYATKYLNVSIKAEYLKDTPLPEATDSEQQKISDLVHEILAAKQANPSADVQSLETQIDHLVYQLYNLTPEEVATIESGTAGKT